MNLKKSLKPIKKELSDKNRPFKTIRRVYTHLSELSNEEILDYYSVKNIHALKTHIEHVKEILKKQIENYEEELEELDNCFCLDSRAEFKYLYATKKEAEKQVTYSLKNKSIKLTLYACPFHCGWHISKV